MSVYTLLIRYTMRNMDSMNTRKFPSAIKLITFDLDDTLWPCMPVIQHAENTLHDWLYEHAPELAKQHSVESLREHRRSLARQHPDIAYNLTLTRKMSLQMLLIQFGYDKELAQPAIDIFRNARNQVEPFEDVIPALEELGKRYYLIAVTNGNVELSKTPVSDHFRHALTAESVGAAKPDPAIFTEAMKLAHTTPEETLHIGDDPETDIEAARQIGLHSIWMNRYQQSWPENIKPAITEVDNLYSVISHLSV